MSALPLFFNGEFMLTYKGQQFKNELEFILEAIKDIDNALLIYRMSVSKLTEKLSKYNSIGSRDLQLLRSKYTEGELSGFDDMMVKRRRDYTKASDERLKEFTEAISKDNRKKILQLTGEYTDYQNALNSYILLVKCLEFPIENNYKEFCKAKVDYESQAHIDSNIIELLTKLQEYYHNLKAKQFS